MARLFNNLSIGSKVFVAFALVIALLIACAGLSLFSLSSFERPFGQHRDRVDEVELTRDIDYAFLNLTAKVDAYLTAGSVLYSNLGHPLMTIVADTCGRHDTLGGACAQESNTVRYALDKRYMHSCRDNFLCACLHDGRLHKRDIGANINFFMNVPVTPEGGLTFEDGISAAGKYVELRAECNAMVLISNCPQLNNPCNAYNPTPVEMIIWDPAA